MIMRAEDERGNDDTEEKTNLDISAMDIYKIENDYYLICSESEIFILNQPNEYSRKLTNIKIENLPVRVIWVGNMPNQHFVSDDRKAIGALVSIIEDFNKMVPNPNFHGFVLESLVTHLRAFLYEQIIEEQRFFYSILTLSGDQHGTGLNN